MRLSHSIRAVEQATTYVRKVGIVPCQQYHVQHSAYKVIVSIMCSISCSEPDGWSDRAWEAQTRLIVPIDRGENVPVKARKAGYSTLCSVLIRDAQTLAHVTFENGSLHQTPQQITTLPAVPDMRGQRPGS